MLRYWETEFRSIRPQKSAKGSGSHSRRDVETLLKVKGAALPHRFTIAGARRKLREGGIEPPTPDAGASHEEVQRMRTALVEIRTEVIALMDELERVELHGVAPGRRLRLVLPAGASGAPEEALPAIDVSADRGREGRRPAGVEADVALAARCAMTALRGNG